jgi:hypothetical protein
MLFIGVLLLALAPGVMLIWVFQLPLLQIDFTGTIKAAHIVQMRNYINEARTALGMPAVSFGADPVARVTRIRGADLHQLRDALR